MNNIIKHPEAPGFINFSDNEIKNFVFDFYSNSEDGGYLYPTVEFTLNSVGNSMSIENITDNNRIFAITDISPNENIVVDNYLQTIVSDTGLLRLDHFNKAWLRFLPGHNELRVISGIGQLIITYSFARKIGA